jgi:hypothetical protein
MSLIISAAIGMLNFGEPVSMPDMYCILILDDSKYKKYMCDCREAKHHTPHGHAQS